MSVKAAPAAMLTVLFKRRWLLLAVFLTVVGAGVGYLATATPKYQSLAELIIRFGDRSIPTVDRTPTTELTPSDRREIVLANSQLLQSHSLIRATIETLGVGVLFPDIVARPPASWSIMDEAVRTLQSNLSVEVGLQNNVISVAVLHPDPVLAPKIVNTMIERYIARESEVYRDPQVSFQRVGLTQAEQRLTAAQRALEEFKARHRITDFDQEVIDLLKRRGDVDASLRAAQAALVQADQRRQDLQKLMVGVPERLPGTPSGEKYRSFDEAQARLSDLRSKQSQMLATYSDNSPALDQVRSGIANAERDLRGRRADVGGRSAPSANPVFQTLQTDFFRATADAQGGREPVRIYAEQLSGIEARLRELQGARGGLTDGLRQVQVADDTYRSLYRQFEDAQVKQSLNSERISNAAVLSQPTIPYRVARPRKLVTLAAALMAGLMLGLCAVLLTEAMDDRFTTPDQLAAALGVPVLATFGRSS